MPRLVTALFAASLLIATGGLTFAADEDDHLRPTPAEAAAQSSYQLKLDEIFHDAYQNDSVVQVLFTGAFTAEAIVSIRHSGDTDQLFAMAAERPISAYDRMERYEAIQRGEQSGFVMPEPIYQMMRAELPGTYRDVPVDTYAKPIAPALTRRIAAVWRVALLATKVHKTPGLYIDGGSTTYSMHMQGRGVVRGMVTNPEADTKMDSLWTLAAALNQYAKGTGSPDAVETALRKSEVMFEIVSR